MRTSHNRLFRFFLTLCLFAAPSYFSAAAAELTRVSLGTRDTLTVMLDQLSSAEHPVKTREVAVAMENYVCDARTSLDVSDAALEDLAKLLEDSAVEYRIVGVLGCLGPKAKATLAPLRRAFAKAREANPLKEREPVLQIDYRLDFKILDAIQKIEGKKQQ